MYGERYESKLWRYLLIKRIGSVIHTLYHVCILVNNGNIVQKIMISHLCFIVLLLTSCILIITAKEIVIVTKFPSFTYPLKCEVVHNAYYFCNLNEMPKHKIKMK